MTTIHLTPKELIYLHELLFNSYDNLSLRKKVTEAVKNQGEIDRAKKKSTPNSKLF